jgi:hypothetical protein
VISTTLSSNRLNVSALTAGTYVLEAITSEGRVVRTFSKE